MEEHEKQSYQLEDNEDFGLQQHEYEPLEREEGDIPPAFEDPTYHEEEEEECNREGLIIAAIIGFLALIGLAVYIFGFGGKEQIASWFGGEKTEQPQLSTTTSEAEASAEEELALETESDLASDPVYEETDSEAATQEEAFDETPATVGAYDNIEAITAPTGRSYIVVGSFVDEDLARDFGNQLLEDGMGIRVLSPTDRAPLMHRVAVADFATFEEASAQIGEYTLTYQDAWVLKY